jgi:hypothetical protein
MLGIAMVAVPYLHWCRSGDTAVAPCLPLCVGALVFWLVFAVA